MRSDVKRAEEENGSRRGLQAMGGEGALEENKGGRKTRERWRQENKRWKRTRRTRRGSAAGWGATGREGESRDGGKNTR
eukprot:4335391-Pleurochrysis_carterae.AAC.1